MNFTDETRDILIAALDLLEEEWTPHPDWGFSRGEYDHAMKFTSGHAELFVRLDGRDKLNPRFEVMGIYPKYSTNQQWTPPRDAKSCRIGVSSTKPVRQIASDIQRRCLNIYFPLLEDAIAATDQHLQQREANEAALRKLAPLAGIDIAQVERACENRSSDLQAYGEWATVRIFSHGQIYLERMKQLEFDQAAAVFAVLSGKKVPKTEADYGAEMAKAQAAAIHQAAFVELEMMDEALDAAGYTEGSVTDKLNAVLAALARPAQLALEV